MQKFELKELKEAMKQAKFYETPWFWICVTVIVMCLTKSHKIVICGNSNGNGNSATKE